MAPVKNRLIKRVRPALRSRPGHPCACRIPGDGTNPAHIAPPVRGRFPATPPRPTPHHGPHRPRRQPRAANDQRSASSTPRAPTVQWLNSSCHRRRLSNGNAAGWKTAGYFGLRILDCGLGLPRQRPGTRNCGPGSAACRGGGRHGSHCDESTAERRRTRARPTPGTSQTAMAGLGGATFSAGLGVLV